MLLNIYKEIIRAGKTNDYDPIESKTFNSLILFMAHWPTTKIVFLECLALSVTTNCICEIDCLALDGFDLKLSSKKKKNLGGAGI